MAGLNSRFQKLTPQWRAPFWTLPVTIGSKPGTSLSTAPTRGGIGSKDPGTESHRALKTVSGVRRGNGSQKT